MAILTKRQIINAMPVIAVIVVVAGAFVPTDNAIKLLIGLCIGSAGSVLFPYYREWKINNEELKFNLVYLMPIVFTVVITLFSLSYTELLVYLSTELAGYPFIIVYLGAIVLGYGGKAMLVGFKQNLAFLDALREVITDLEGIGYEDLDDIINDDNNDDEASMPYDAGTHQ